MLQNFYSRERRQSFTTDMAIISAWVAVFIPGHLYGWLVERSYSALLLMIAIASFAAAAGRSPLNYIGRRNNIILLGLFIITVLYVFAAVLTTMSSAYGMAVRDILDFPRYIIIGAVFVIMGNADPDRLRAASEKLIIFSLSFSLVVLLMYIVDVPLLSNMVRWLYEDTKTAITFPRWVRLAAPFENPNFLAFYTVLCFSYALFFASGKRRFVLTALALVVLIVTGSRSGWVAAAVLIAGLFARVLLGVFNTRRSILRQDILFLILFALITSCLLWFLYPYLLESARVKMVVSALEDGGLSHERNVSGRLDMIVEAFRLFVQRPIIGWGPLKEGGLAVIDNQYSLVLARLGFVGFILIMGIMLYVFSGAVKFAHTWADKFGVVFMWFAVALLLMTGAFLDNFRLFVLFVFFVVASTGKRMVSNQSLVYCPSLSPEFAIGRVKGL